MRSRLMARAPAARAISSSFPSTWSGTPDSIRAGGVPRRAGQYLRTRSWSAPMPPLVMTTAGARSEKGPSRTRELGAPRSASSGSRRAPIAQREIARVVHAKAALLGRVDHQQTAERPERLTTQGRRGLLIEQDHALPGVGDLGGRDEAREPRADDDDIGVHAPLAALHDDAGLVPDAARRPHEDHLHAVAGGAAEHDPRRVGERTERGKFGVTAAVGARSERGGQVVTKHL